MGLLNRLFGLYDNVKPGVLPPSVGIMVDGVWYWYVPDERTAAEIQRRNSASLTDRPKPGSDEALALGCSCPVMDNAHGAGRPTANGVGYYVSATCSLHGD